MTGSCLSHVCFFHDIYLLVFAFSLFLLLRADTLCLRSVSGGMTGYCSCCIVYWLAVVRISLVLFFLFIRWKLRSPWWRWQYFSCLMHWQTGVIVSDLFLMCWHTVMSGSLRSVSDVLTDSYECFSQICFWCVNRQLWVFIGDLFLMCWQIVMSVSLRSVSDVLTDSYECFSQICFWCVNRQLWVRDLFLVLTGSCEWFLVCFWWVHSQLGEFLSGLLICWQSVGRVSLRSVDMLTVISLSGLFFAIMTGVSACLGPVSAIMTGSCEFLSGTNFCCSDEQILVFVSALGLFLLNNRFKFFPLSLVSGAVAEHCRFPSRVCS